MGTVILVSNKSWNISLLHKLKDNLEHEIILISNKDQFVEQVSTIKNVEWIFILHWNYIIPKEIWKNYRTVIFHMTDLPFGRGGSPLQNLIQRKFKDTKMSAIECTDTIDGGNIYLKKKLNLNGSAEEIYLRSNELMREMIIDILENNPIPTPQKGEIVNFKRRTPDESNLNLCSDGNLEEWYDHIRMLDAEGYPNAFLEINGIRIEFRRVNKKVNYLLADVIIKKI